MMETMWVSTQKILSRVTFKPKGLARSAENSKFIQEVHHGQNKLKKTRVLEQF
jgi:hypothetical protein